MLTKKSMALVNEYAWGSSQVLQVKHFKHCNKREFWQSVHVAVDCGVPQGSVIGPINFILFSAPLQDIIAAHGVQFVVYADDTQLYLTFQPQDREAALNKIESCIADIMSWCKSNMLVLNDKKTEMLYFQSHFNRPTCHFPANYHNW